MKKRDKKKKNWSVQPLLLPTHLSGLPSLFICKCMVYYCDSLYFVCCNPCVLVLHIQALSNAMI